MVGKGGPAEGDCKWAEWTVPIIRAFHGWENKVVFPGAGPCAPICLIYLTLTHLLGGQGLFLFDS